MSVMNVLVYMEEANKQLISIYGFDEDPDLPSIPVCVPDGVYPMIVDGDLLEPKITKEIVDYFGLIPDRKKKGLKSVLRLLKKTAKKFRDLEHEAKIIRHDKGDYNYRLKLEQRARLLIAVRYRLAQLSNSIHPLKQDRINLMLPYFETEAREAIKSNETTFRLNALLTESGSKSDQPNELEKLIEFLEA